MYHSTPRLGAMYQTGQRFSLAGDFSGDDGLSGWSPEEWAKFFAAAEPAAAQLYGTIAGKPVASVPMITPQVQTPIGSVPTWGILAVVGVVAAVALSGRRSR